MEYKIEKNIPIPEHGSGRRLKHPFSEMKVGDSILSDSSGVYTSAFRWASRQNNTWKFRIKVIGNKTRIWRIK